MSGNEERWLGRRTELRQRTLQKSDAHFLQRIGLYAVVSSRFTMKQNQPEIPWQWVACNCHTGETPPPEQTKPCKMPFRVRESSRTTGTIALGAALGEG